MDKVKETMERWNALLPLAERDRELLSRRFTIDFNYNSNHIEGNTLTYGHKQKYCFSSEKFTPVELAALFHYRYIRIHPFEDGNGRM